MTHRRPIALAAALAAAALSACGGSTSGSATGPARISVRLVDTSAAAMASDPASAYEEVNIDILRVEIWSEAKGWHTIATPTCANDPVEAPGCIVNLLRLTWDGTKSTQGVLATLADGETIEAGRYGQMRLVLGPYNSVRLKNAAAPEPLKVPSGEQSGVKLIVNFEVAPGTTKDVYIDFAAHRSVFVHGAGKSGKYILRPTVRAFDKLETGTIKGTLTADNGGGAPPVALPGIAVTAQTLSDTGVPTVVASTVTATDGTYVFPLVRAGVAHYVVAQPYVPNTAPESTALFIVYPAKTSGPLTVTPSDPVRTWDATFQPVDGGAIRATVGFATAPPVEETPLSVQVRKGFDLGGSPVSLVVRDAPTVYVPADPPVYPVVDFANLPAGALDVLAGRPSGEAFAYGSAASASVAAGGTAEVNPLAP